MAKGRSTANGVESHRSSSQQHLVRLRRRAPLYEAIGNSEVAERGSCRRAANKTHLAATTNNALLATTIHSFEHETVQKFLHSPHRVDMLISLHDENIEISPRYCMSPKFARRPDMRSAASGFKICSRCSLLVLDSWVVATHSLLIIDHKQEHPQSY